jgi:hypothetical protein
MADLHCSAGHPATVTLRVRCKFGSENNLTLPLFRSE